jgi:hypothetical protein
MAGLNSVVKFKEQSQTGSAQESGSNNAALQHDWSEAKRFRGIFV